MNEDSGDGLNTRGVTRPMAHQEVAGGGRGGGHGEGNGAGLNRGSPPTEEPP